MFRLGKRSQESMVTVERRGIRAARRIIIALQCVVLMTALSGHLFGQTDCVDSSSPLETTPPKGMTEQELIQKFAAQETKVRDLRSRYTYTQDVLVQTLDEKTASGQWHQVSKISYDDKGKRVENVTFSEQSTLRDVQISPEDLDDIRTFMPWILTTDQLPQYKLTYAGHQHVDDLDTYVFHVEPATFEKNTRYFQGKIWIDDRDLQMVKLCGKSVPDQLKVKKHQPMDVRPTFVGYRQYIDGSWFPAYARVDDTLHFQAQAIHIREIVKFTGYQRTGPAQAASKP
jgi:hypothetical protein